MRNPMSGQVRGQTRVFTPIIRVNGNDFSLEEVLNKVFETGKNCTNIRFTVERI